MLITAPDGRRMILPFRAAADGAEPDCLDKYLNLSEKSFPGTSCLCAQRPAVMADDYAQKISQGLVTERCCNNGVSGASASKSSSLLSEQETLVQHTLPNLGVITASMLRDRLEQVGAACGGKEAFGGGRLEGRTVDSGLEILKIPALGKEPEVRGPSDKTEGSVVGEQERDAVESSSGEQKCARAQEVDLNVGMRKEVSDDADKACTAVAPPSESAEMTTGDKLNKQKQQNEEREKKQGPSDSAITVCRIWPEGITDGSKAISLAGKLVASDFWETILRLERRESKMSAYDVLRDKNAMKPKMARKCLHPRWVGGSWGTELAATHKLAIYDVFERRRNGETVTGNAVREHKQCFKPADSMPAQRRDPKEEGSLAILAGNPVLWLPYLLLAAAALMLLVPPQMATEARASSNNRLSALKRRGAPSFVNGYTSSDLAIGLQACNPRLRAKPWGATGSVESLAAPARAPMSKGVPCTIYVKADVSSSTLKPRVIAPLGGAADAVIVCGS